MSAQVLTLSRLGAESETPRRKPSNLALLVALGVGFAAFGLLSWASSREPMVRGQNTFDQRMKRKR